MSVKCICINDKNMPLDFRKTSSWPKEKQQYHITEVYYIVQSKTLGCSLAEFDLSDNFPYTFFALSRFAIPQEEIAKLEALIKKCKEDLEEDDLSEFYEVLKKEELVEHE